jgi:hypothetical protein
MGRLRRRDVRPSSDSKNANEKARCGFLRAGFQGCCDDGVMPLICPTCQMLISSFQKWSCRAGYLHGRSTSLSASPGRKQLQKPVFLIGRSRFRKAEDRRRNGIVGHRLAAEDATRSIVFLGRRGPMWSERGRYVIGIGPVCKAIVKRRGTTGRESLPGRKRCV